MKTEHGIAIGVGAVLAGGIVGALLHRAIVKPSERIEGPADLPIPLPSVGSLGQIEPSDPMNFLDENEQFAFDAASARLKQGEPVNVWTYIGRRDGKSGIEKIVGPVGGSPLGRSIHSCGIYS